MGTEILLMISCLPGLEALHLPAPQHIYAPNTNFTTLGFRDPSYLLLLAQTIALHIAKFGSLANLITFDKSPGSGKRKPGPPSTEAHSLMIRHDQRGRLEDFSFITLTREDVSKLQNLKFQMKELLWVKVINGRITLSPRDA